MSQNDWQPVNGQFPSDWDISPDEVKAQIRRFLSGSNCIFADELEDRTNEILQETVQRYMRYVKDHDEASILKPKNYIRKIARNLCLDFVDRRKKKLENEVRLPLSSTPENDESSLSFESIYDERDQPEHILLSEEESNRIFSLIDQLPHPLRDVIRLKAQGALLREIARHTSMSCQDAKKCIQEGQEQLRQLLHQ